MFNILKIPYFLACITSIIFFISQIFVINEPLTLLMFMIMILVILYPLLFWLEFEGRFIVFIIGFLAIIGLTGLRIYLEPKLYIQPQESEISQKFHSKYIDTVHNKFDFWRLIPEADWMRIGTSILGFDGVSSDQQNLIYSVINEVYDDMKKNKDYKYIPSELGRSINDFIGINNSGIHYYLYTPNPKKRHKGLIVYFHGAMGNFLVYPWLLNTIGDLTGYDIAYVTHGTGYWDNANNKIKTVVDKIYSTYKYRNKKVILMGVGKGGKGVSRYVKENADSIDKIIYISGVVEPDFFKEAPVIEQIDKLKGVFIMHGRNDKRYPLDLVNKALNSLNKSSTEITYFFLKDRDHFLIFEQAEMMKDIAEWILKN